MSVAIVRKKGKLEAIDCHGRSPELVAKENDAELVDFCSSMSEARWTIANNHTGKIDSI